MGAYVSLWRQNEVGRRHPRVLCSPLSMRKDQTEGQGRGHPRVQDPVEWMWVGSHCLPWVFGYIISF